MFSKVLIANRGEIAVRIIRACRELEIATVAVYSDVDRDALHVRLADEAYRIGPARAAESYLDAGKIFAVARRAGCGAIHPGYGFFAENAQFARQCAAEGLAFIGPSPAAMERVGAKLPARRAAVKAGMPVVPGSDGPVTTADEVRAFAKRHGYPVAIKASAGGGGKGLKVAFADADVGPAMDLAAREALAYFKDATLYLERYLARPKHVEVQVFGDKHGAAVHFGERDCSMQRRHQKLVEETPASIPARVRDRMHAAAVGLVRSIGYDSAGTVECLVEGDEFYFLEMNTRIQVEHTVTEATWGVDLVKAQIRVAAGEPLWFAQTDLSPRGHAIECRINAESPEEQFRPSSGTIAAYEPPSGPGIRIDGAAFRGWRIPAEYDSLLAKLVAWGADREEARMRMVGALSEFVVEGVDTTIGFLRALLQDQPFVRGTYATPDVEAFVALHRDRAVPSRSLDVRIDQAATEPSSVTVEVNERRFDVRVFGLPAAGAGPASAPRRRFAPTKNVAVDGHSVTAPMHGILVEVRAAPGDAVHDGQVVAIIEAMKMMNEIVAHRDGVVASVDASPGETLEMGSPIVTFRA